MKYIVLLTILSCGKIDVKVDKIDPVNFGPDFAKAIEICDTRYGKNTIESDQCFKDYRTYFSPKVTIDPISLGNFCNSQYNNPIEIQLCKDNLTKILTGK